MTPPSLVRRCVAELIGTFVLVFFGVGSVHAAVLTGAQSGLWQVALPWPAEIAPSVNFSETPGRRPAGPTLASEGCEMPPRGVVGNRTTT